MLAACRWLPLHGVAPPKSRIGFQLNLTNAAHVPWLSPPLKRVYYRSPPEALQAQLPTIGICVYVIDARGAAENLRIIIRCILPDVLPFDVGFTLQRALRDDWIARRILVIRLQCNG